jgi:hypothetical protein
MDETYQQIYAALYGGEELPRGPFFGRDFWPFYRYRNVPDDRIRAAIDKADARLRRSRQNGLRSDAKAMLLLNLTYMIVVPLVAHGEDVSYPESDLESDVNVLVDAAVSRSGDESVSAHSLVDALSANWRNLKLANVRLWGATQEYQ